MVLLDDFFKKYNWGEFNVIFFSAVYTLYLYSCTQHGMYFSGLYSCLEGGVVYIREYYLLFLHWFPLSLLILFVGPSFLWF